MQMKIKKRFGFAAVLLLLLIVLSVLAAIPLISAEGASTATGEHTITVKVDATKSGGTIKWFSGTGGALDTERESGETCAHEAMIRIVATPNTGYKLQKILCVENNTEYTQGTSWDIDSVTKNLTFVAYFEPKRYELTSLTSEPAGVQYSFIAGETIRVGDSFAYGADVTLPIPQIDTYEFRYWVLNGNIKISDSNKLPLNVDYQSGLTLTAVFTPKKYTVTVIDRDADTNELIGTLPTTFEWSYNELVKVDGSMELPIELPTRSGYTYDSASDGRKVRVSEAENIFYRWFRPNTYKVTLNNGNAAAVGGKSELNVEFNRAFGALAASDLPTLAGYRFAGYYDKPNGMGRQYIDASGQASVENGNAVRWGLASNDGVLYAHWIPNDYTLSFGNDLTAHATVTVKHGDTTYTYDGTPLSFPYGTVVSVTVKAQNGYKLVAWNGTAIAHAAEMTVSFTIPAENTELTGTVLPVCSVPSFRADYPNETLTAEGGIPSGSYVLRVDGRDIPFDGTMTVSLSEYFGKTVQLLCRGDGTTTADSEWFSLVLAARPESPIYGEGGKVEKPSATENSVSFTVADGETVTYEFACVLRATDKPVWQDSGSFAGLKPGTTYTFYIRVKATETAPHGEVFSMTVYTLNENYLKGEIEKLRGEVKSGDGKNVSDLITVYVTRMEALEPSADYQEELEALMRECREKLALARYKDGKITEIDVRCAELLAAGLFNEAGKETLADLQADAIAAINGAATTQGVDNARRDFDAGVEEIPVRIDLTGLLIALGIVIFCQIVVLIALLSSRARYADRVRYARAKTYALCPLPVVALTARFLPEKPALIALLLGAIALVLQIVITVLLFRSTAISKRGNGQPPAGADPNAQSGGNVGEHKNENGYGDGYGSSYSNGYGKGDRSGNGESREFSAADPETEDEPATDSYAFSPQMSILGDDGAPAFDRDDSADALQEEDWYDETFEE